MTQELRIEEAAKKFFSLIAPGVAWDYTDHKAKPLVLAAFRAYHQDWGSRWDIRRWEWPFEALKLKRKDQFDGDQPWAVLFRHAIKLARA